jgi:hypothetical protein
MDDLPPIRIDLDDDCSWLVQHGAVHADGLHQHESWVSTPARIREMASHQGLCLPRSFDRFMCSSDLQSRIRSSTACFLDPAERIIKTVGAIPGHLIHFLSDSQSCAHWYVHIYSTGKSAVLESQDLYCYSIENSQWMENQACKSEEIDLVEQGFFYCERSFSEFLFRFWIENEIFFALYEKTRRPLTALETDYVSHYKSLKRHSK